MILISLVSVNLEHDYNFYIYVMHVCVCGHIGAMAHAWGTEDNSKNQVSPFNVWVPGIPEGHN